jgi:predicted transposase YdaD
MKKITEQRYSEQKRYKHKKELKRFDLILKEIFSKAVGIIFWLSTGQKIEGKAKILSTEIRFVKSFYPDILLEIEGKIIHIEVQVQQDKTLPERMLDYFYAIRKKYGKTPTQIVLFVCKGNPPPNKFELKDEFQMQNLFFNFVVLDMKKINPDEFIKSEKPEEVLVGVLAGKFKDKPEIIKKVKKRIVEIVKDEKEIAKYIDSISFLAGLFEVEIKVKPMPIEVDIRKTFLYKWGKEEGLKEGEQRGLVKGLKHGKQEGLKEGEKRGIEKGAILGIIQAKFGSQKAKLIKNILDKIDDINYLKTVKKEVIRAKTWDDFIKVLKNPNSKNKNSKGK